MTHQIEILDLLFELNEQKNRTIVMVLHDLNLASRYAHNIVAIKDGGVYAQGKPEDIITCDLVRSVFGMECQVSTDPFLVHLTVFHMVVVVASYKNFGAIQVLKLDGEQLYALERFSVHVAEQEKLIFISSRCIIRTQVAKYFLKKSTTLLGAPNKYCGCIRLYEKTWFFYSCPTAFNK